MPTYEYRCKKGHTFEVVQRMIDDPVEVCPRCGAEVQRVFHPIAVHFKGKGFYNTDYGTKKRAREKETADASAKSGAISDSSKSDSSSESKSGVEVRLQAREEGRVRSPRTSREPIGLEVGPAGARA